MFLASTSVEQHRAFLLFSLLLIQTTSWHICRFCVHTAISEDIWAIDALIVIRWWLILWLWFIPELCIIYVNPYWFKYNECQSAISDMESVQRLEAWLMSRLSVLITTGQEKRGLKKWCGEGWEDKRQEGSKGVSAEGGKKQLEEGLEDEWGGGGRGERERRKDMRAEERNKRWQKREEGKEGDERIRDKRAREEQTCQPTHSHVRQFTMFWPIMFYSTITDSTVVSSDLISQPISFSNVNTKGEAEPLAASSAHLLILIHNWLPWKEAGKGKQQAIILTPVSPNWNPLTISTDDSGCRDGGAVHTASPPFPHAALCVLTRVKACVCIIIKSYVWFLCSRAASPFSIHSVK